MNLKKLTTLDIRSNLIKHVAVLNQLEKLKALESEGNFIEDLEQLRFRLNFIKKNNPELYKILRKNNFKKYSI